MSENAVGGKGKRRVIPQSKFIDEATLYTRQAFGGSLATEPAPGSERGGATEGSLSGIYCVEVKNAERTMVMVGRDPAQLVEAAALWAAETVEWPDCMDDQAGEARVLASTDDFAQEALDILREVEENMDETGWQGGWHAPDGSKLGLVWLDSEDDQT